MECNRLYNFSAGPSMMPEAVLKRAQNEMMCYGSSGTSVMEMSHRSLAFENILQKAETNLKTLMHIPDQYEILFLQGGATMQFSQVPYNLAQSNDTVSYAVSGYFSKKAYEEGSRYAKAMIVASSEDRHFTAVPSIDMQKVPTNSAYLHVTGNNTIYGTTYWAMPDTGQIPLVADWSSAILGIDIDVSKYGLIYAGAQKNIGPAGVTLVIIRKDLLERPIDNSIPPLLRYAVQRDNHSMYNTPPCYAIYMANLMFEWVLECGGVEEMQKRNIKKAKLLYDYIDHSNLFSNMVATDSRSIMNVVFTLPSEEYTKDFIEATKEAGLLNLKGHRLVGGCRASLYNGMPYEGVEKLVEVMQQFEKSKH